MAKNSVDVYGAVGKTNTLFFTPESLMLISDPNHPLYDERIYLPLDEAMVLNIMAQGVLEPIIIWKDPESGATCVVDGRQRVRHAIEANRRLVARGEEPITVPGVVRRGSAVKMAQAMVSANEIRRADTPLGRAKKMAALQERGHDDDDLALVFGCSTATVRATLSLLDSPASVQQAVEAGQITVTHARQLAALPADEQRAKVEELIQAGTGVRPHERSRKQRAVMANDKPRLRTRKEITAELEKRDGPFAEALRWVLGIADDAEAA